MANPIQPFAGGGGWSSIIPQEYLGFTSGVADKWKSEKDAKVDNIISSLAAVAGNISGTPEMANTMFPSALGKYYQQASEAQGKAKAYEGLVKASPELFGLSNEQAKSFTDFASKLPPTAVPEFYQMALKGGMMQQELGAKMMAGKKSPLNLEGLDQGFMSLVKSPTQQAAPASTQPVAAEPVSQVQQSGVGPKPIQPTVAELDEFDRLHPNHPPGAVYVDTLSKWLRQKRGQ